MVEYKQNRDLSEIFKAVSDPTRRALLTQLSQEGPSRITDLAAHYDMSLNAISKHIKVLEKAKLVTRNAIGRTHWIEANVEQINTAQNWFNELKSIWELRIEKLGEILNREVLK